MAIQDGAQLTFHLDRLSRDNGMFNRSIIRMSIFKGLQLIDRMVLNGVESCINKIIRERCDRGTKSFTRTKIKMETIRKRKSTIY